MVGGAAEITIGGLPCRVDDLQHALEKLSARICSGGVLIDQMDADGAVVAILETDASRFEPTLITLAAHASDALTDWCGRSPDEIILLAKGSMQRRPDGQADRGLMLDRIRGVEIRPLHVLRGPDSKPPAAKAAAWRPRSTPKTAAVKGRGRLTMDDLRDGVRKALGPSAPPVSDDADLVRRGLDSLAIMRLADGWRRRGGQIRFSDLMREPNLSCWWALVQAGGATPEPLAHAPAGRSDAESLFDLTPVQHAYWTGRQEGRVLGGVGCHFYAEFDGGFIDAARLQQARLALIDRHDALRTRFSHDGRQEVIETGRVGALTCSDLRFATSELAGIELEKIRERLSHKVLEVERGEVFALHLSCLPDGRSRLHANIDLLAADVRSIQILLNDLADLFQQPEKALPPINLNFRRYLIAHDRMRAPARPEAIAYWRAQLDTLPGAPQLPLRSEPMARARPEFVRRKHWLSAETRAAFCANANQNGLTPSMAFAAAYCEVLAAWSVEPRFLLNLPLFDRQDVHPAVESMVADFTNILLLTADHSQDCSFAVRAAQLQSNFREAASHAAYSGVEVLRDLAKSHGDANPRAPVVFTCALGMGDLFSETFRGCFGDPGYMISQTPQVWLDHQVLDFEGGVLLNWDGVEALFEAGVLDAMFAAYVDLVAWLSREADWDQSAPMALPAGQALTRARVNGTAGALSTQTLHGGVLDWARRDPRGVALAWGEGETLSFAALAERALRLAGGLVSRGVAPGAVVAVSLPKGVDQVVAALGVLCAGCAYVPVGVDQPLERRRRIYADAGVRLAVGEGDDDGSGDLGAATATVSALSSGPALSEPRSCSPESLAPEALASEALASEALAYVIYTSGSTGTPKGVEISHRAAVNTLEDVNARYGVGPGDRVLAVSALDFDLSVYDLFGVLAAGGAAVLIEEEARRAPERWLALMQRFGVTLWNSVPALLEMLLETAQGLEAKGLDGVAREGLETLRLALVSGDWVGLELLGRLRELAPSSRLVALGGATEAGVWSNAYEVDQVDPGWRSIPYGLPLRNQRFRVVDGRGRDCADWVAGELWIGGAGVAQGYRGQAALTAQRFVSAGGERWYRTGDLGRYRSDGVLEFLGRTDQQVKIGGHRVELGEVEAALQRHPAVEQAIVAALGGRSLRLVAAVSLKSGAQAAAEDLTAWLSQQLPSYMRPDRIVILAEMPLSANGKLDRKAVATGLAQGPDPAPQAAPPVGPTETALADIWRDLLQRPDINRNDNFIALGGHSVLATKLASAILRRFNVQVTLRELFGALTISEQAQIVEGRRWETGEQNAFEEAVL